MYITAPDVSNHFSFVLTSQSGSRTAARFLIYATFAWLPELQIEYSPMSSKNRRIAVVIPKYGLVGGAEVFALELTERLARMDGYELHVLANKWVRSSENVTFHKVPVITFPRFLTTPSFAHFVRSKMRNMDFDLVHSHERIFDADVFTMHGIPHRAWVREVRRKSMSPFDYATEWVEKSLVNNPKCRRFLAVSNLSRDFFIKTYPAASGLVRVMRPGIRIEEFVRHDRQACRRQIRAKFGIGLSDSLLLFVSMNFELKGLEYLIRAIARVHSRIPAANLKLLVVGKGNRKKYEVLARGLGISERISFFGICRQDIERIYLASDAFVLLSRFDTFGISVLEAMAASLPVIVSSRVGAKDLVKEGINGFVLEEYANPEKISSRIMDVISNPGLRETMAQEAFNTAMDNTWEKVATRTQKLYQELFRIKEKEK